MIFWSEVQYHRCSISAVQQIQISRLELPLCSVYHSLHTRKPLTNSPYKRNYKSFFFKSFYRVHSWLCMPIKVFFYAILFFDTCTMQLHVVWLHEFFLRKKTNIVQSITEAKQTRADKCKHYFVLQPWQNPPSCSIHYRDHALCKRIVHVPAHVEKGDKNSQHEFSQGM